MRRHFVQFSGLGTSIHTRSLEGFITTMFGFEFSVDTARKKAYCPKRFYQRRHKIENFFRRIKDWRRIATRYDKLARNFLAATTLIGALYWIKL